MPKTKIDILSQNTPSASNFFAPHLSIIILKNGENKNIAKLYELNTTPISDAGTPFYYASSG
jgi:hypothetical protein